MSSLSRPPDRNNPLAQSRSLISFAILVVVILIVVSVPPISIWGRLFGAKGAQKASPTPPKTQQSVLVSTPTALPTNLLTPTGLPPTLAPSPIPPAASSPTLPPIPAATATATPVISPTKAASTPTATATLTRTATLTPTRTVSPTPSGDAVVNASPTLNMRSGPGTNYGVIAQLPEGAAVTMLGKLADGTWYKVKASDGKEGWVKGEFLTINIDKAKIPVATPPPTPTPAPATATPTPGASPTLPPAPPPSGGSGFGYGVQASMAYADLGEVMGWTRGMGFNWIKTQVGWKYYESSKGNIDFGRLDQIVNAAQASGIRVLFSVVKAPDWARGADKAEEGPPANYNDYGDFVAALATRYRGRGMAYEIWNEQNLKREWTGEPLSAARYVQLLAVAYARIKAADPAAIVVSGGLTPTGWNDGVTAIDDVLYMQQMYQAGLIRYCDAVGAHPPGYNVPPSAEPGYQDPTATFRGPFDNPHPSWFFKTRMLQYRNVMVQYGDAGKRIWPTEFGWASIENVMAAPIPGWDQARDNSEAEQAAWLVEAFNLCRSWGFVGPLFVWNLNFGVTNPTEEYANFGIIRPNKSPRPAYAALRDMPK